MLACRARRPAPRSRAIKSTKSRGVQHIVGNKIVMGCWSPKEKDTHSQIVVCTQEQVLSSHRKTEMIVCSTTKLHSTENTAVCTGLILTGYVARAQDKAAEERFSSELSSDSSNSSQKIRQCTDDRVPSSSRPRYYGYYGDGPPAVSQLCYSRRNVQNETVSGSQNSMCTGAQNGDTSSQPCRDRRDLRPPALSRVAVSGAQESDDSSPDSGALLHGQQYSREQVNEPLQSCMDSDRCEDYGAVSCKHRCTQERSPDLPTDRQVLVLTRLTGDPTCERLNNHKISCPYSRQETRPGLPADREELVLAGNYSQEAAWKRLNHYRPATYIAQESRKQKGGKRIQQQTHHKEPQHNTYTPESMHHEIIRFVCNVSAGTDVLCPSLL